MKVISWDDKAPSMPAILLFFIFEAVVKSSQNRGSDRRAINKIIRDGLFLQSAPPIYFRIIDHTTCNVEIGIHI